MDDNTLLILDKLFLIHKDADCELDFKSPFELLIAVILSAQCTDKRVNTVCKNLFPMYSSPQNIVDLGKDALSEMIKPCGFYHNKSHNIINACNTLLYTFDGIVPDTISQLESLAGVGRKTANVVYSVAFGGQAIAVDTHVLRVSNRIGLAKSTKPSVVESTLMRKIPQSLWTKSHHALLHHGRYVCKARTPLCDTCGIAGYCNHFIANKSLI